MVLAKNAFSAVVVAFMIWLVFPTIGGISSIMPALAAGGLLWMMSAFVWRRTWVSFHEDGMECIRDTRLTKRDRTIPYSRLASVGVNRSFMDRLFGTSVLQFNVNSGASSTTEATLTLCTEEADALRDELNRMIFVKDDTIEEERGIESLVHVSNSEIVVHSFLSQSTPALIWAVMLLIYSVYSAVFDNSSGLTASLLLLFVSELMPVARKILVYSNYRLYRVGDTVTVESGLLTTSRRSFKVSRINSVRMGMPLVPRLMGRATLEAEVVGLQSGGDSSDDTPLLCPLKPTAEVLSVMRMLLPEAVFEPEEVHQPSSAMRIMGLRLAVLIAFSAALAILIAWSDSFTTASVVAGASVAALASTVATEWTVQAHRWRSASMGPVSFMLMNGGIDRTAEYILYDKVQKASVSAGPLQRRSGLARLDVSLLGSSGFRSVSSGMFDAEELERVPAEVMARIRDGRYDWRRYV